MLIEHAIKYGEHKGVEVEVYHLRAKRFDVSVEKNRVKKAQENIEEGMGIRVICDGALGFTYLSNPTEDKIEKAIDLAIKLAEVQKGNYESFPEVGNSGDYGSYDPRIKDMNEEECIEKVMDIVNGAQDKNKNSIVSSANFSCGVFSRRIANSSGEVGDKGSFVSATAFTVIPSNPPSVGIDFALHSKLDGMNPYDVGKNSAEMAMSGIDRKTLDEKPKEVIFAPLASREFFGILVQYLSGVSLRRKQSPLLGKFGEEVFSENLNIYCDEEDNPFGRGFDDEGVPTRKRYLVEKGVIKNFALDMVSAKKMDMDIIGFATRSGINFRSRPEGVPYTIKVDGNSKNLIEEVDKGIVVNYVTGLHTINYETGDFSVGTMAPVLYIERGEVKYAVKNVMLSGNLVDMFSSAVMGKDNKFLLLFPLRVMNFGMVPSLKVDKVSVVS